MDYHFSPLAPGGETAAVIENRSTAEKPCRHGDLALMDTLTGERRKTTVISGLPSDVFKISLCAWLNAEKVAALTMSVRCRPASEVPDDESAMIDPPYQTMTAYAVNVRTGKARKLDTYSAQGFFQSVLPGAPGHCDLRSQSGEHPPWPGPDAHVTAEVACRLRRGTGSSVSTTSVVNAGRS
ncbi:hypothetical protein [Streptosporangium sandarakinum]